MSNLYSRGRRIALASAAVGISLLSVGAVAAPVIAQRNVATDTSQSTVVGDIGTVGVLNDGTWVIQPGSQGGITADASIPGTLVPRTVTPIGSDGSKPDAGASATVVVGAGRQTETFHATVNAAGQIEVPAVDWSTGTIPASGTITVSVAANGSFTAATGSQSYSLSQA